jgi:hypothetical protein
MGTRKEVVKGNLSIFNFRIHWGIGMQASFDAASASEADACSQALRGKEQGGVWTKAFTARDISL